MTGWQPALMAPALMALAGAGVGAGLWLLVAAPGRRGDARPGVLERWRGFVSGPGGVRLVAAVVAGLVVLVGTRWVPVAAATTLVIVAWPVLFGAAAEQKAATARLEALAAWVESLRDTTSSGRGLAEAIPAVSARAEGVLARPLRDATSRMAAHEPIEPVLRRLADDIDDPAGDQVVAALILTARVQGKRLPTVLTGLALSTRREVETRRKVDSDRRSTRRVVQIVLAVVAAMTFAMATVGRDYAAPYTTPAGQVVLLVVVATFLAAFWWLRRLSTFTVPARFLAVDQVTTFERVSWDGEWR